MVYDGMWWCDVYYYHVVVVCCGMCVIKLKTRLSRQNCCRRIFCNNKIILSWQNNKSQFLRKQFVMTKVVTISILKHVFCCNRSMHVATRLLSWQKLQQARFSRSKTFLWQLLSRQSCCDKHTFVTTHICHVKTCHDNYVCCNMSTSISLSWQNHFCYVATNTEQSVWCRMQLWCVRGVMCNMSHFLVSCFVATNVLVMTKLAFVLTLSRVCPDKHSIVCVV